MSDPEHDQLLPAAEPVPPKQSRVGVSAMAVLVATAALMGVVKMSPGADQMLNGAPAGSRVPSTHARLSTTPRVPSLSSEVNDEVRVQIAPRSW